MISAETRLCCVIGDPIKHTLSPLMHNAAFEYLGLEFIYVAFRVKADMLKKAVDGMRAFNIKGMNVTIPHKVRVMEYLDVIDEVAREIGAVNTIVNDDGVLKGFNTDGEGALKALKEGGGDPKEKKIVILGAGGAARAVSYFIAREGPSDMVIINRTVEKAVRLARCISEKIGLEVRAKRLTVQNLKDELEDAEILINCTSVGMTPNINETLVPKGLLRGDMIVMDIVYNPVETRLLREAKERGCLTIDGVGMLVYQGAIAFEMWTGVRAPVDVMREVIIKALRGRRL
ncbi:MAG: shikimate dehydrogenase [Thermoprotei archaeon]|nr:MAG: shikimate dehydrogenase [Thermoprotei archaeon]